MNVASLKFDLEQRSEAQNKCSGIGHLDNLLNFRWHIDMA